MDLESRQQHLSRLVTSWTMLEQAHEGGEQASAAQRELLQRYYWPVYRYLFGALRDPDAANDVFQEFSLRFLRGDFRRADPEKGRFRDFLKTTLYHLIVDFQRRKSRSKVQALDMERHEPAVTDERFAEADREFAESCRQDLLERTWKAFEEAQRKADRPYFAVLRCRADNPGMSYDEMAEHLSRQFNRPLNTEATRQLVHRAREKFADTLLDQVTLALEVPTIEQVEQEILDLGLLPYCQAALERRKKKG
jgi:RNA polymerase sigma-70 factor (ECF subfamily)